MKIQSDDLIEMFYKQLEDNKGLTLEQVSKICKTPFNYFRTKMALHDLPLIKVKYFGKFIAYEKKKKRLLINLQNKFNLGKISKEDYENGKNNLHLYLDKNFKSEGDNIQH